VGAVCACGPGGSGSNDGGGGGTVDGAVNVADADPNAPDSGPMIDAAPSSDAGIQGCNPQNFTLQQDPPPEIYLVVDRSGSMLDLGSSPPATKWDDLRGAADAALTQFEAAIHFGVLMYPEGDECVTPGPQVGFAANNRTAITNSMDISTPAGGTPTAAALNNAAQSLADFGTVDSPKFLVLMTDGGPNCNYFLDALPQCSCNYASSSEYCCTSYPDICIFGSSCLDDANTLDVITDLSTTQGVDTFVIGLPGTAEYESLLNAMAVAGGQPQMNAATDYYNATSQAEISDALNQIAVSVISCQIPLSEVPENPDGVRIFIDGNEVPRNMTNGWDYTDSGMTDIELYGDACNTLQDGDQHTVTATFACVVE
jgi:hypothetical protein